MLLKGLCMVFKETNFAYFQHMSCSLLSPFFSPASVVQIHCCKCLGASIAASCTCSPREKASSRKCQARVWRMLVFFACVDLTTDYLTKNVIYSGGIGILLQRNTSIYTQQQKGFLTCGGMMLRWTCSA